MNPYMVVATFKTGTNMKDVFSVVAEEQARVAELKDEGLVGSVFLATASRQTVFLEVHGGDEQEALKTVNTLPMACWWDIDVYPLNPPASTTG